MSTPRELSVSHVVCNGNPGVFLVVNDEHHLLLPSQAEFLIEALARALTTAREQATQLGFKAPPAEGEGTP